MALTVGTDTYISVADTDAYVAGRYVSTDAKYTAWTTLSDANKEVYLRRAASIIDRQPLVGVKVFDTQTMQFPRAIHSDYRGGPSTPRLALSGAWYVQSVVPDTVKYAQVEIALQEAVGVSARLAAQRDGVKSVTLGKISETYRDTADTDIPCREAKALLRPYLATSVGIA
jgi:hypothetical protein